MSKYCYIILCLLPVIANSNQAAILGWIPAQDANLCHGYYLDPDITIFDEASKTVKVTATEPAMLSHAGASVLQGVTITQTGRVLAADKITLQRSGKNKPLATGTLVGNIHLYEQGKAIFAENGVIDFSNNTAQLNNTTYRITTALNAWGTATKIARTADGLLKLQNATYSTCPPTSNTWKLWNQRLTLNKNTGRGKAYHTILYAKSIPILYLPYFNFPIDNNRQTGFLYPNLTYASNSGFNLMVPYYLNLAPNYDAILTPQLISKRGLFMNSIFNYLTPHNQGFLDISYIPHDTAFVTYRNQTQNQFVPSKALTRLQEANNYRGMLRFHNQTRFNQNWNSLIKVNYVSDDYFLQDFGTYPTNIDNDQLLNQAELNYADQNWHFTGKLQVFQTLHPITQALSTQNQYKRLPQLNLTGDFAPFHLDTELVNFQQRQDFATNQPIPAGSRFNIHPSLSWPLYYKNSTTLAKIDLMGTWYGIHDTPTHVIPLFSCTSSLFFDRQIPSYIQTLEPQIFYLLVPKVPQDKLPLFDTTLPAFNYEQIFRTNRFSGPDRVGDAHQIAFAVTSRFLNDQNGEEKFHTSIGQVYLFHKHTVNLANHHYTDPLSTSYCSPFAGELQYIVNKLWNLTSNISWNPNNHKFNNTAVTIQYQKPQHTVVNLNYNFVHNDPQSSKHLENIGISTAFKLRHNWNIVGDWNYNMSHYHPQTYLYGLEYNSCCFALRVVKSKTFTGQDIHQHNNFNDTFYLQFLLKGLGNLGNSNAGSLLTSRIPGYQDNFTGIKL